VNQTLSLLLTGVLFIVLFGLLSLVRREGVSRRFFFESAVVTAVFVLLSLLGVLSVHPVVFLIVVYLITMRVRLVIDLGGALARRGRVAGAGRAFKAASMLGPDRAGALLVRLNQGACALADKRPAEAIPLFQDIMEKADAARLGAKYRAACRYNLGIALWRENRAAEAAQELEAAQDAWPASTYARRAENALKKLRESGT
jgi:tetratricopeptide (TPR) repeat protein